MYEQDSIIKLPKRMLDLIGIRLGIKNDRNNYLSQDAYYDDLLQDVLEKFTDDHRCDDGSTND
ncbi:hypothetical protein Pan110_53330 [Gimesia panareensis]|nr:hypothetical protein Pan110_53330 [Gimesia panareensis]